MKKTFFILLGFLTLRAKAEESSPEPTQPPASKTDDGATVSTETVPATHTITVGAVRNAGSNHAQDTSDGQSEQEDFGIEPNRTSAEAGDVIEWEFRSGAHWIIRGSFAYPCIPFEYIGIDRQGFSSGEQRVDEDDDDKLVYRKRINDTLPILFYSGAPGACVDHLMMGVINPGPHLNLKNWKEKAKNVTFQLRPGDPWPEDEDTPTDTAPSIPTATDEDQKPSPSSNKGKNTGDRKLSDGAITGIAIGGAVILALAGVLIFYCGRRGGIKIVFHNSDDGCKSQDGQDNRYPTPATVEAPFRPPQPPRSPNMDNWRSSMDEYGRHASRHGSPDASAYAQSLPPIDPYKTPPLGHLSIPAGMPLRPDDPRMVYSYCGSSLESSPAPGNSPPNDRPAERHPEPVELPVSSAGNPPPSQHNAGYAPRKFSWAGTGEDALFRTYKP